MSPLEEVWRPRLKVSCIVPERRGDDVCQSSCAQDLYSAAKAMERLFHESRAPSSEMSCDKIRSACVEWAVSLWKCRRLAALLCGVIHQVVRWSSGVVSEQRVAAAAGSSVE